MMRQSSKGAIIRVDIYKDIIKVKWGFSGSSDGKETDCNEGDLDLIPGLGRSPEGGHNHPLQYSCLENPHGQRSLAGYSPWVTKSRAQLSIQS